MGINFKTFLISENKAYLTAKVGDILSAIKELNDDSKNMGTRDLVRFSEKIVNHIRTILHSDWSKEERKYLMTLQKVGVALMKAIEDKDDLPTVISSSANCLQKLVADLGMPINKIAAPDKNTNKSGGSTEKPEKTNVPPDQSLIPPAPPSAPSLQANFPPLGGNTGGLNNF